LKKFYLTNAQIQSLPEEIGSLTELRELMLQGCPITKLPESICSLEKLEFFSIASTQIEKIPGCIGNWQNLKELRLNNIPANKLPDLSNLKKLEHLCVNYSQIKKNPEWLATLPLKTLTLYEDTNDKGKQKIIESLKLLLPDTEIKIYDLTQSE
jgi:Leucine-rich repeat (LRR) protein